MKAKAPLVGLTILVAGLALWFWEARSGANGFNWPLFRSAFFSLNRWWLLQSIFWAWGTYVVRALRWKVLLRPIDPWTRLAPLLNSTVIGFSAVTVLGRAGEMVRPYLIAKASHVPFASQVAAWIVERIYDTIIALAIFGFAMTQVSPEVLGPTLSWAMQVGGAVIVFGISACLGILILMRYRSDQVERWVVRTAGFFETHHLDYVERLIGAFLNGFRSVRSQGATLRIIVYTILEWVLVGACYACIIRAFGTDVRLSPAHVLVLMGFATFGSLVQLPAVGGGVQVTIVLVLTEIFGIRVELATTVGLLIWFVLWVSILPVGVMLAIRQGLTWAGVRDAARVAEAGSPPAVEISTKHS